MIKSYIKTALRHLRKQKGYSFINIFGLAIGIACCILILLWVRDELSYDGFHAKADRLFRLVEEQPYAGGTIFKVAVTPGPLGPALIEEIPEVINACRYTTAPRFLVGYKERRFYESGMGMADPSFWKMFGFKLIKGDPDTVFKQINALVISENFAVKYFGDEDPLDKALRMENMYDLVVKGVMEDVPSNSHLQFDCVMPFELLKMGGQRLDQWGNNSYYTYAELAENANTDDVDQKIRGFITKHHPRSDTTLHLQSIKRIHLHSDYVADVPGLGDIRYIFIFSLTAFLVLLIACINFMNLATARAGNRAREVGMRKVTGASRVHIMRQFLGESVLYALFAFILALGIVSLLLPAFGNLAGKTLSLGLSQGIGLYLALIGIALLTGLGAGIYPALYLSGFKPVDVLRGSSFSGPKGKNFRRILVVFQFSLSIGLIIISIIIQGQINFIHHKDIGFDRENVIYERFGMRTFRVYESFKNEALRDPNVVGVTSANSLPIYILNSTSSVSWPGKDPNEEVLFHNATVTHDYFETLGMEMAEGRAFSREHASDAKEAYIINQAAARVMGEESPVGKPFTLWGDAGTVIGVVKNFHFKSMNTSVEPLVIRLRDAEPYTYLMVRIKGTNIPDTLDRLTKTWNTVSPAFPFDYTFLDEEFDRMYRPEQRIGTIFGAFTVLAIIIASLGLLGLAAFVAERRTHEIGVRKVLGATMGNIVYLLSREFAILVAVANIVAWPAAYYIMRKWLQNYAYHIGINPLVFLGAGILALFVALFTVSWQALRAASVDPVDSLRYE
ncbi:MAG: ABC transporter permease [Candidatus Aminicenantes bacterium]|nr:ABC transporter permease [Candidatus Aminicenantes bacterium]